MSIQEAMKEHWTVTSLGEAQVRVGLDVGFTFYEAGNKWFNFLKSEGLEPKHKLLDLGCGCGRIAIHLIPYLKDNYRGCDVSPTMLKFAEEYTWFKNCFDLINGVDLPYPDGSFDYLIGVSVFTHVTEEIASSLLKEIKRVTRKDAKIYLTIIAEDSPLFEGKVPARARGALGKGCWDKQSFKEFVGQHGFSLNYHCELWFTQDLAILKPRGG